MADSAATSSPTDFASELNPAQRLAATSLEGAHLVIAGAGSGKTRTLVYRVAFLVHAGIAPESILLLTFTRRAAQEMLRRAAAILDERCRRVAGGTFHAFANLVLRRYAPKLGFGSNFTILDRADTVDLMGILRTEGGFDRGGRRFPRADAIVNLLSKQVNTGRPLEQVVDADGPQWNDELPALETLRQRFAARKKEQNVMDYDDLLVHLRQLLVEHADARARLGATYRYLMVDEYQDTNRLQAHVAALLAAGHGNLMVVGDDAQSIYAFRGASFRNIIDFPKIFPDCRITLLEQNYRSTQPILDLGNAILENAREKYAKKLFSEIEGDRKPTFVRTSDDYGQAEYVALRVLELREEGVPLGEIAVLARAAWHTNTLEVELRNRNIPFRKFGGIRFVEAAHVKDVSALLKLSVNPLESGSWFRILQLFPNLGASTAHRVTRAVEEAGGDVAALLQPAFQNRPYSPGLRELHDLLTVLSHGEPPVSDRLARVLEKYSVWMRHKYDDTAQRLRDLETLQVLAERYSDVEEFLSDLAIDPPDFPRSGPGGDLEDEWMTVSTVHSAKGLEWHTVFVLELNNGRFPAYNSLKDAEEFEEERRLLYVAVTRARRQLYLLKPEEISSRGGYYEVGELSPLISEIRGFDRLVDETVYAPQAEAQAPASENAENPPADTEQLRRIQDYFG